MCFPPARVCRGVRHNGSCRIYSPLGTIIGYTQPLHRLQACWTALQLTHSMYLRTTSSNTSPLQSRSNDALTTYSIPLNLASAQHLHLTISHILINPLPNPHNPLPPQRLDIPHRHQRPLRLLHLKHHLLTTLHPLPEAQQRLRRMIL